MENRTSKYFKYAVGEIFLVVIGILIALQLNNWNDDRLENDKTNRVLKAIYKDIIKDTLIIDWQMDHAQKEVNLIHEIEEQVTSDHMTLDSIIYIAKYKFSYFWVGGFEYTNDSYESVKSSGFIDKIPDSLKYQLIDFYNSQLYYSDLQDKVNLQYRNQFNEFMKTYSPIITRLGDTIKKYTFINNVNWSNVDPSHLNPRFYALIKTKRVLWEHNLLERQIMFQKSRDLLQKI